MLGCRATETYIHALHIYMCCTMVAAASPHIHVATNMVAEAGHTSLRPLAMSNHAFTLHRQCVSILRHLPLLLLLCPPRSHPAMAAHSVWRIRMSRCLLLLEVKLCQQLPG